MNQLTVRGFDDVLWASVRNFTKREGISLNQAALKLLPKGAGLTDGAGKADIIGSSLEHLIGTWTSAEAEEFESIDKAAWKGGFS